MKFAMKAGKIYCWRSTWQAPLVNNFVLCANDLSISYSEKFLFADAKFLLIELGKVQGRTNFIKILMFQSGEIFYVFLDETHFNGSGLIEEISC